MTLIKKIHMFRYLKSVLLILFLNWSFGENLVVPLNEPNFAAPIENVTTALGREAILACTVQNLSTYKVAWLRVDTQTILTIHTHVISRSRRVGVTHSDHKSWFLHIRELRESDRGWYMCQINTDPMKSQLGFLNIVVPPDIVDRGTSTDQVVGEGASLTLTCETSGSPKPQIIWRREHGEPIKLLNGQKVSSFEGSLLELSEVKRQNAGAYLCIASNGVPPSVSKRITLTVEFAPIITLRKQLLSASLGSEILLECNIEAYPKPISYWSKDNGDIIPIPGIIEPIQLNGAYRSTLRLPIKSIKSSDYGSYKCVSKNFLGDTEGTVKIYPSELQQLNMADKSPQSTLYAAQDFRFQDNETGSASQNNIERLFLILTIFFVLCLKNISIF